ncbi:MAG: ABC transporter permease [Candidatus Lokiarchaeota archaeon]|nr:ABC transporter permease [Candidatus Harpocratesius repetitus]
MNLMDIKVLREIKIQKFRSFLIITIITVTIALILGMHSGGTMVLASYEENLRQNNVADGRFTFTAPVLDTNITQIQNDSVFLTKNNIADIEGRLIIYTEMTYNDEIFPCLVIGVDFPNIINKVYLESIGENITDSASVLNETTNCIIESRFAGIMLGQDVQLGENVSVLLGVVHNNFTVQAIGQDTDQVYVVDPVSQMTLMGQMAIIWVNLSGLQQDLFGGLPLVNQILFTVDSRLDKSMINHAAEALTQRFISQNIDISTTKFTIYDETDDRTFFDADAGSIDKMGTIFGAIGLVMCCVAIFNTISRLVQAQRKNIGLYMSMGAEPSVIILHYMKITMILSLIGVIIGVPLGHFFATGMTKLIARFFPFQTFVFPIVWQEYLFGSLITFAVCVIFSGISAFPITKITPREAMSAVFNRIKSIKSTVSEKFFSWIPIFHPLHMRIPIREIFLRKRKSIITILAISTSMIMMINSLAMVSNMFTGINRNFTEYNTADYQVILETPIPVSEITDFMNSLPSNTIDHYEAKITLYSPLYFENDSKGALIIECYQENSTLRNVHIIQGSINSIKDTTPNEIIMGSGIADKFGITLGDTIQIGLFENISVKVVGLVGELIDYSAFWSIEAFQSNNISTKFGLLPNYVNGFIFNPHAGVDITSLRAQIENNFSVAQWVNAKQSQQSILTLMQSMMSLLFLFILIGMFIGIFFSFNTMYMGFISRENDFLAFKAMGTNPRYFTKMIFWENAILSVFSLIITVPVGYYVYWRSMDYLLGNRYYMPLSIPWYTWPLALLLSFISIWMATLRLTKRIRKMNLADELRSQMVS